MRALVLILLASCVSAPLAVPVYDCQAEDGSGRTVRVAYAGNPVKLSEGLADEPGGLWSCYPGQGDFAGSWRCDSPRAEPSAAAALLDLRSAAELTNAASCSPYPWRLAAEMECD